MQFSLQHIGRWHGIDSILYRSTVHKRERERDYVRLLHFHDGKSIVFENSICTFVWNQHHSRTLSEGIRFGGSSGMPTNCDHFWQEASFVVCPTVIQKNIEIVFSLRYSWAFVRGGGWEGGVNRVSRKYLLSINTYYLLWSCAPSVFQLIILTYSSSVLQLIWTTIE